MDRPAGVSPRDYVLRRLDEAGETLMSLPMRGVYPTRYRSSMPDYLRLPEDGTARLNPYLSASHAAEGVRSRPPVPGARAVSRMDEVYGRWIPILPAQTEVELVSRRIVLRRSLVYPGSDRLDPHVWSWHALGREFGVSHHTAQSRFDRAVDLLAWRLDRLPPPCREALDRILRSARAPVAA